MSDIPNFCERCKEQLNEARIVWLELDNTTGKYLSAGVELPLGHVSQGFFPFGMDCSKHPNSKIKK